MDGTIINYRRGRHRITGNQMVIDTGLDSAEKAQKLAGKTVVWVSPAKKEIKGSITSAHGSKGAVRALFETGMPGQAIGQKVKIQD